MANFQYIGDPAAGGDDPASVTAFGICFAKGEAVAVEDKHVIAKLEGNSHFEKVDGRTLRKKRGNES